MFPHGDDPVTPAVQRTLVVRAPGAIVDLIAVENVEAEVGAVPPDRVLNKPGKDLWIRRVEFPGIDPAGNGNKNVSTPAWPVAPWAIRVTGPKPVQNSGSMKKVVNQGVDDNKACPNSE